MRSLAAFAFAFAGSLAATTALAQQAQPPMTYRWDQQADARAFARNYPDRALQENLSGAAVMCCTVNPDRTLNCLTPLEWPAGYGFGEATLAISREFRLSEASYAEISNDPNHLIRRTIRWLVPSGSSEIPAEFREAAATACDGPAVPVS